MYLTLDNRQVFVATGGKVFDPSLPVIAFVHGAGMDHTVWSQQTRWFAYHGYAVLAPDLPGHGASDGPPLTDTSAMAGWVFALLNLLNVRSTILVGHSLGAIIALRTSARAATNASSGSIKINKLALLGAAPSMPVHPRLLQAAEQNNPMSIDMITLWGHGPGAKIGGNPAPGLWMLGCATRLIERAAAGVLYAGLKACQTDTHLTNILSQVTCPTLVLSGNQDQMTSPHQGRELADLLPQGHFTCLQDCGHMVMVEQPYSTLQALATLCAFPMATKQV